MNGQFKSTIVIAKRDKMKYTAQHFNQKIDFLNQALNKIECLENQDDKIQILLLKCYSDLNELIQNEYFHLNYINNPLFKQFTFRLIEICFKFETDYSKKMDLFKTIEELLEWEVNLEEITFVFNSQFDYEDYFIKLIPYIKLVLFEKKSYTFDLNNNLMSLNQTENFTTLALFSQSPQAIIPILKTIAYMFLCVRYSLLIKFEFIQDTLDFLLNHLLISPVLNAEMTLAIAVNICEYKRVKDPQLDMVINEEAKLLIHDKCSNRAVYLMEINIRNESCRNLLKKALNIYCEFITRHLEDLTTNEQRMESVGSEESEFIYEDCINHKWRQLLYKIVISIVKILRTDFEDDSRVVDIELVIYFYELLKSNLDSLTYEDSLSIAQKLMDIIVKISEWSQKSKEFFKETQFGYLKSLSFELTIKFITILKHDFCRIHWVTFEELWLKSIHDWDLLSFKAISAFCQANEQFEFFCYKKSLAQGILSSWLSNLNQNCKCNTVVKHDPKTFINIEIICSVIDLAYAYDKAICLDDIYYKDYREDIVPLLNIFLSLFKMIDSKEQLILFNRFYTKIFKYESPFLKNFDLWREHFMVIINNLNMVSENNFRFEMDTEVFKSILDHIKNLHSFMGGQVEVQSYRHIIENVLIYIYNNSNLIQTIKVYQDIFSVFKKN